MIFFNVPVGLLSALLVWHPAGGHSPPTIETAAPESVIVTATDYRLALPDTLPAGPTTFRLVNHGRELHHLFLVRLRNGKTAADLAAAMKKPGPFPSWAVEAGGPNGTDPGSTSLETTLRLWPGRYAALCIIPGPDGVPHVMKGMIRDLFVRRGPRGGPKEPAPAGTISLFDYGFQAAPALTAGRHLVLVKNDGKQTHELELARLLPGKTPDDLAKWAEKMSGRPPATFLGGVSPLAPGRSNELALDLTPGHYVFLCFVPDAKDGKPHIAHGMVRDFVIS